MFALKEDDHDDATVLSTVSTDSSNNASSTMDELESGMSRLTLSNDSSTYMMELDEDEMDMIDIDYMKIDIDHMDIDEDEMDIDIDWMDLDDL